MRTYAAGSARRGNFIEYVPFGVLLLGLVEAQSGTTTIVLTIGSLLAFGRVLRAIGMFFALPDRFAVSA